MFARRLMLSKLVGLEESVPGAQPSDDKGSQEQTLNFSSLAIGQLAIRSAVLIAGILTIPDAIAVIASYSSPLQPVAWAIRVLGLWLQGLVSWFVSFLIIAHTLQFLQGAVRADQRGIKLGRLDKLTKWEDIQAITCEEQPFFSKLLNLPSVYRLSIFYSDKSKGRLSHKDLPSFLFTKEEFADFAKHVTGTIALIAPQNHSLYAAKDFNRLRNTFTVMRFAKALMTVVIAFGLISFLGRKAIVNYTYNLASREMRAGNVELALEGFQQATFWEPSFAQAWYHQGAMEFRLNRWKEAERHWNKALLFKPDMVEPKVSLAFLGLVQRQFGQTRILLEHALKRDPENSAARLKLAEYYLRVGDNAACVEVCRKILLHERNLYASCFIAQAMTKAGRAGEAVEMLDNLAIARPQIADNYMYVYSRALALTEVGSFDEAARYYDALLSAYPTCTDYLLSKCDLKIRQADVQGAAELAELAHRNFPQNPWVWIAQCEIAVKAGDKQKAESALLTATTLPNQDLNSVKKLRQLGLSLGRRDLAKRFMIMSSELERKLDEPTRAGDQLQYYTHISKSAQGT